MTRNVLSSEDSKMVCAKSEDENSLFGTVMDQFD